MLRYFVCSKSLSCGQMSLQRLTQMHSLTWIRKHLQPKVKTEFTDTSLDRYSVSFPKFNRFFVITVFVWLVRSNICASSEKEIRMTWLDWNDSSRKSGMPLMLHKINAQHVLLWTWWSRRNGKIPIGGCDYWVTTIMNVVKIIMPCSVNKLVCS